MVNDDQTFPRVTNVGVVRLINHFSCLLVINTTKIFSRENSDKTFLRALQWLLCRLPACMLLQKVNQPTDLLCNASNDTVYWN